MKSEFEFIIQYLRNNNISIDFQEFQFQVETHPNFPSLYAFSDTLDFFNINNSALKVAINDINLLPNSFIALLKLEKRVASLAYVRKVDNGYIYYHRGTKKLVSRSDFEKIWGDVALVAEKDKNTIESTPKPHRKWFYGFLGVLILLLLIITGFANFSLPIIALLILGIVGCFLSIQAIKEVFGIESSFSNAVCGDNSPDKFDCKSVISSEKKIRFLNFELSDWSVVFFVAKIGAIFLMSIGDFTTEYIAYSSILFIPTVPVVFYSLFYQWKVEKKWCPICLMIIGTLVLEAIILLIFKGFYFNANLFFPFPLLLFLSSFIIVFLLWILIRPLIKEYVDHQIYKIKSLRFKRNYDLFKLALKNSKTYDYSTLDSEIQLGGENSKLRITLITNPSCGYCKNAHSNLKAILARYQKDVSVNIRFNLNLERTTSDFQKLHYKLFEIYLKDGQDAFINALSVFFKTKDLRGWHKQYLGLEDTTIGRAFFKKQFEENRQNELMFTPKFIINERLYPNMYDIDDLIYFVGELIDDKDLAFEKPLK